MKKLILQTYVEDDVDRGTRYTYKRSPKLERLSIKCFRRYAKIHGADYELYTPDSGEAHWIRMVMFDRPAYDVVLYVDCDILIHPIRYNDNVFLYNGTGVHRVDHITGRDCDDFNMGVVKWNSNDCAIMREHIDDYYHPHRNQDSLNTCYKNHVGEMEALPYKFNVTHRPDKDVVFRHYAGFWKDPKHLKACPIWKYYK